MSKKYTPQVLYQTILWLKIRNKYYKLWAWIQKDLTWKVFYWTIVRKKQLLFISSWMLFLVCVCLPLLTWLHMLKWLSLIIRSIFYYYRGIFYKCQAWIYKYLKNELSKMAEILTTYTWGLARIFIKISIKLDENYNFY